MTNKDILNRVFTKYERMKKILAYYQEVPPYAHQRLTQQIDEVKVQTSGGTSPVDKAIISRDDAEYYIKLIDKLSKMPKICRECPFYKITDICDILSAWNNYMPILVPSEGKHPDCPLKEVKEDE